MFESIIDFFRGLYGMGTQNNAHPGEMVDFMLNDPITNEVIKVAWPAPRTDLPYTVLATKPPTLSNGCYITLSKSTEYANSIIGKIRQPLNKWPGTNNLQVIPLAGKDLNAFYDRLHLKFFYAPDPVTKKMIYAASSTDVVSHEHGHGILDCLRPDFWNVQNIEIWSFHEAFGDINAIMFMMQFDEMINYALQQTGGDLRQSNIISRLAEELGLCIYHYKGGKDNPANIYLRDAVNNFSYVDPTTLPSDGDDDQLIAECHSFGRVWAGTWYLMFCGMYEQNKAAGQSPLDAAKAAKDLAYEYLIRSVVQAPNTPFFTDGVARGILAVDKMNGSPYQAVILKAFQDKNVLRAYAHVNATQTNFDIVKGLGGDQGIYVEMGKVKVATIPEEKSLKVSDVLPRMGMTAMHINGINMHDLEMTVAADKYYEFDEHGHVVHQIVPDMDDVIAHAQACLSFIHLKSDIGPDTDTLWEVQGNKIVRTLFV